MPWTIQPPVNYLSGSHWSGRDIFTDHGTAQGFLNCFGPGIKTVMAEFNLSACHILAMFKGKIGFQIVQLQCYQTVLFSVLIHILQDLGFQGSNATRCRI